MVSDKKKSRKILEILNLTFDPWDGFGKKVSLLDFLIFFNGPLRKCEILMVSKSRSIMKFYASSGELHEITYTNGRTVSTWIEPQSWLDPHPTKILIEPQSKRDIEIIEPHLELTPTQATNTFVIVLEMGKLLNLSMYLF